MREAIEACPKEFFKASFTFKGYLLLANDLFAHYARWHSMTQAQIDEMNKNTDMSKYSEEKWLYVQTWLKSFEPKHEQKQAVVAWCLSLMMTAPPPYTLTRWSEEI